jgi:fumarate reductase subunit D
MWSSNRKRAAETVVNAVKSAGSLVVTALITACAALAVALIALAVAVKWRPASA